MASKRRRRKSKHTEGENLSDVAAWLYTDLLLGLAVVFIGGGAFFVQLKGEEPAKGANEVAQPMTYQLSCDEVDLEVKQSTSPDELRLSVDTAVSELQRRMQWEDIKPALINLYGRVDRDDPDGRTKGQQIAEQFVSSVISQTPSLSNVEIALRGGESGTVGTIRLKIYFVYKGQIKDNGCQNNE